MHKPVLAIFDFCDTIFDGQSVSFFLDFLESKSPWNKRICSKIIKKINMIPSSYSKKYKENLLKPFYGMSSKYIDDYAAEFYNKIISKRLHKTVIDRLLWHKQNGDTLVIASGGFYTYLKYFAKDYGIDYLICTRLMFENGVFVSKILGNECLGDEKIKILRQALNLNRYDLSNSFCYSDSKSDIPLFTLVGNKIVVVNHQDTSWINDSFKILKVDGKRQNGWR